MRKKLKICVKKLVSMVFSLVAESVVLVKFLLTNRKSLWNDFMVIKEELKGDFMRFKDHERHKDRRLEAYNATNH